MRSKGDKQVDGRVLRGRRVREAVLRAMLELVEAGNIHPTMAEIAARAGVSLRAVFNHFKDAESMRAAAIHLQAHEEAERWSPIPSDPPLQERIDLLARQRAGFLESVTPFRRAANVIEAFSPQVSRGLRRARERSRARLEETFQPELAALPDQERAHTVAMLVLACSWPAWDALRSMMRFNQRESREIMADLMRRILLPLAR